MSRLSCTLLTCLRVLIWDLSPSLTLVGVCHLCDIQEWQYSMLEAFVNCVLFILCGLILTTREVVAVSLREQHGMPSVLDCLLAYTYWATACPVWAWYVVCNLLTRTHLPYWMSRSTSYTELPGSSSHISSLDQTHALLAPFTSFSQKVRDSEANAIRLRSSYQVAEHQTHAQVQGRLWTWCLFAMVHYTGLGYLMAHFATIFVQLIGGNILVVWRPSSAALVAVSPFSPAYINRVPKQPYTTSSSFSGRQINVTASSNFIPPANTRPGFCGTAAPQHEMDFLTSLLLPPHVPVCLQPPSIPVLPSRGQLALTTVQTSSGFEAQSSPSIAALLARQPKRPTTDVSPSTSAIAAPSKVKRLTSSFDDMCAPSSGKKALPPLSSSSTTQSLSQPTSGVAPLVSTIAAPSMVKPSSLSSDHDDMWTIPSTDASLKKHEAYWANTTAPSSSTQGDMSNTSSLPPASPPAKFSLSPGSSSSSSPGLELPASSSAEASAASSSSSSPPPAAVANLSSSSSLSAPHDAAAAASSSSGQHIVINDARLAAMIHELNGLRPANAILKMIGDGILTDLPGAEEAREAQSKLDDSTLTIIPIDAGKSLAVKIPHYGWLRSSSTKLAMRNLPDDCDSDELAMRVARTAQVLDLFVPLLDWANTGIDINHGASGSGSLPLTPADLQKCLVKLVKRTAVGVDDEEWNHVLAQLRADNPTLSSVFERLDDEWDPEFCDQLCFGCMRRWDGDGHTGPVLTEFVVHHCSQCQQDNLRPFPICRSCVDRFSVGTHCKSRMVGDVPRTHCCSLSRNTPRNFYLDLARYDVFDSAVHVCDAVTQTESAIVDVRDAVQQTQPERKPFCFGLRAIAQAGRALKKVKPMPTGPRFL